MNAVLWTLMFLMALFLILLVLIQRGRGGGLAGAFGGLGGQSAFGTKAGDVFTRVTIIVAGVWIALCIFANWWNLGVSDHYGAAAPPPGPTAPAEGGKSKEPSAPSGNLEMTEPAAEPATGGDAPAAAAPPETPATDGSKAGASPTDEPAASP